MERLMPLTTRCSASVEAGTIQPPGHMQKKDAAPLDLLDQLVRGGAERWVAGMLAELDAVDEALWVLDA